MVEFVGKFRCSIAARMATEELHVHSNRIPTMIAPMPLLLLLMMKLTVLTMMMSRRRRRSMFDASQLKLPGEPGLPASQNITSRITSHDGSHHTTPYHTTLHHTIPHTIPHHITIQHTKHHNTHHTTPPHVEHIQYNSTYTQMNTTMYLHS